MESSKALNTSSNQPQSKNSGEKVTKSNDSGDNAKNLPENKLGASGGNKLSQSTVSNLDQSNLDQSTVNKPISIKIFSEVSQFSYNKIGKMWAAVTIKASSLFKSIVPRMDFIIVIDKSGSMRADKKMANVQGAIHYILTQLASKVNYRLAVITFNSEVELITENIPNDGEVKGLVPLNNDNVGRIIEQLKKIKPEGATNMSSALEMAMDIIKHRKTTNLSTILFFTDGLANVGKFGHDFLYQLSDIKQSMPKDLTFHTFGFGLDHDSKLLQRISLLSKCGIYYYVENVENIGETFASCLGTILSTIAHEVVVIFEAQKGCRIINNYTKFPITEVEQVKKYSFELGSMSLEESRTILTKLSLNKSEKGDHPLLSVIVQYTHSLTGAKDSTENTLTIDRSASTTPDPPTELPFPITIHYWRFTVAATIEDAVKEISNSRDEERFAKAQRKMIELKEKMEKEAPSFCKEQIGKDYLHILKEMELGMQNAQIYSAGVHYAHAFTTTLFLERSAGTHRLMGMQEVARKLSIIPLNPFERRRYFPAYVTTYQEAQLKQATQEIPRYVQGIYQTDNSLATSTFSADE